MARIGNSNASAAEWGGVLKLVMEIVRLGFYESLKTADGSR